MTMMLVCDSMHADRVTLRPSHKYFHWAQTSKNETIVKASNLTSIWGQCYIRVLFLIHELTV